MSKSSSSINQPSAAPSLQSWLTLVLLGLVWGSSYILIKKGLVAYSPVQLACLRITISALAFFPFFILNWKKIDWSKLRFLLIVGFMGSGVPAFLFAFAQTELSSSMAGVLSSLTPLFTLSLGILIFGRPLIWAKVFGVLIGLAGAVLLILFGSEAGVEGKIGYGLLVVVGCVCYATSVNTVETYLPDMSSITISAVAFVLIGVPAVVYLFLTDFTKVLQSHPDAWASLGYITILALFGTVLASILFFKLVHMTSAVFSSTVSYLIPLVAILWGLLDGEVIGIFHLLGMGLILLGVYMSRKN